jgi:parvulin-like peptidyl-prolyl isomerase
MKALLCMLAFSLGWPAASDVLATVGNDKITTDEFARKLDEIRKQPILPPTPDQFLEDMVRFSLGVQEAEKLKLQDDPMVKERFRQVLYNTLLEKKLGQQTEDIQVSEREIRDYYKKNPDLQIAHILIELKPDSKSAEKEAVHKHALEIWDEIRKGKRPFDEYARQYSEDQATKDIGGDIGYQARSTLVPSLYDVAVTMKVGEVKGPVESPFGYHILKLIDKRNFDLADKRQIRAVLADEKRSKLFAAYFEKLKKQYKVDIHREALKSFN